MKLKHDHMLAQLCHFGFRCEEKTADGFLRYSRRIGDLLITVANGQFENKIRLSMLEDKEGHIRTSYHDLHAYTDLIGALDLKRLEELDPEGMKRFYKDHPELEEQSQVPKKKKRNQMER